MNLLFKHVFFLILLLCGNYAIAQISNPGIYIGQPADSVLKLVGEEVQGHYGSGGYLTKVSASTEDHQGKTATVILCKENILVSPIPKGINFCTRYMMQNDTLSIIRIQFRNLSEEELKSLLIPRRTNISGYYFDPGYHIYHHVYKDANGLITDDQHCTVWSQLPPAVAENLRLLLKKW